MRLVQDEDGARSNRSQRITLQVLHVDLRVGHKDRVAPAWYLAVVAHLLKVAFVLAGLVRERPGAVGQADCLLPVDEERLHIGRADICQVVEHIGEKRRLHRHKHRNMVVLDRPPDDRGSLAPLADAGLVGDDDGLVLLHLVDASGNRVHLETHQSVVQILNGVVAKFLARELVDVADRILERRHRVFPRLAHVRRDQHPDILFLGCGGVLYLELIVFGA